MIKESEQILLNKLATHQISDEEFFNAFKSRYNYSEFDHLLEQSLDNEQMFHTYLWYLPTNLNDNERDKICKKYILKNEHHEHEEMLLHFHHNFINPEENVKILLTLIDNPPDYFFKVLRQDVFIHKCFSALAKQPKPYSINALNKFLDSDNPIIAHDVKYQIKKINSKND